MTNQPDDVRRDTERRVDDYLWDGSGPPDPDVARLERELAPLRHRPGTVAAPRAASSAMPRLFAAAAVLAVAAGIGWLLLSTRPAGWGVETVAGRPTIDARPLAERGELAVGQWLETNAASRVEVSVADIGSVKVHPDSRVRLVRTEADREHRLELARGTIEAFIYAPPRLFFVDTPAAVAVDYGCIYTLDVDEEGNGSIDVTLGLVMMEGGVVPSTVPAGARCVIRAGLGPGTPFFADAAPAFRTALDAIDTGRSDAGALDTLLATARDDDRLTLWHLLQRVDAVHRGDVVDAMTDFAPLPDGVAAAAIMRLDEDALRRWWSALERSW